MSDNDNKILVAIECITYNHEPYIRECLEGFVMQKTNFRFVAMKCRKETMFGSYVDWDYLTVKNAIMD